jgi:hypothetical protein
VQRKVARISQELTRNISGWQEIEAIVLGEAAEIKTLDPYFNINLDVYHYGSLIPGNDRRERLGSPLAFETAPAYPEDRFLMEDLPVRVRYQDTARFDLLLERIHDRLWVYREYGTTTFYRLRHGQVLYQKSPWLEATQQRLQELPEHFWTSVVVSARALVTYYLNDLNAAVYREDNLYYSISQAGFIRALCCFLFAYNRRFEPSGRMLYQKVMELPKLPNEFSGRFESFLRVGEGSSPTLRKREIAELLAKSILAMA